MTRVSGERSGGRPAVWGQAPARLHLGPRDVHVWRADIAPIRDRIDALHALLSQEERRKADRFRSGEDRERFVAGRGVLRSVLGDYLGLDPAALRFESGEHGKPALTGLPGGHAPTFNVSHSAGIVLIAVAAAVDVGVDVQWIRPDLDWERIAARFFSVGEVAALRALPRHRAREAFFACWAHKEAYVKARGEGLQRSFDRFTVTLTPGTPAVEITADDEPKVAAHWSLHTLEVGDGYAGALAVGTPGCRVQCWAWR